MLGAICTTMPPIRDASVPCPQSPPSRSFEEMTRSNDQSGGSCPWIVVLGGRRILRRCQCLTGAQSARLGGAELVELARSCGSVI
jgi:hypothetical protein